MSWLKTTERFKGKPLEGWAPFCCTFLSRPSGVLSDMFFFPILGGSNLL